MCVAVSVTMKTTIAIIALAAAAGAQEFQCPHDYGFYAHPSHCDQYWACENSVPSLRTCGNGLAFDDTDPENLKENCDYSHNIECGSRTQIAAPISTPHCDYLYGVFPDAGECETFYSCWAGDATRYQCGPGLAYSRTSRTCTWMDQVPECNQQRADANAVAGITCPASGTAAAVGAFSRHAHPEDCRQYFVCFDGTPREYGCPIGTVFQIGASEGSGQCADPKAVPGCEDYYGDIDISVLKTLGL